MANGRSAEALLRMLRAQLVAASAAAAERDRSWILLGSSLRIRK